MVIHSSSFLINGFFSFLPSKFLANYLLGHAVMGGGQVISKSGQITMRGQEPEGGKGGKGKGGKGMCAGDLVMMTTDYLCVI